MTTNRDRLQVILDAVDDLGQNLPPPEVLADGGDTPGLGALAHLFDAASVLDDDILGERRDRLEAAYKACGEALDIQADETARIAAASITPAQEEILRTMSEAEDECDRLREENEDIGNAGEDLVMEVHELPPDYQALEDAGLIEVEILDADDDEPPLIEMTVTDAGRFRVGAMQVRNVIHEFALDDLSTGTPPN